MITDQNQFAELLKVIQTNPDLAAKKMAQLGLTPEQFMQMTQPSFAAPPIAQGIAPDPNILPSTLGTFAPGPAVQPSPTPMQAFTPPGAGEVPMPTPIASTQAISGEPDPMIPGFGPQVAGMQASGPSIIGDWSTQVNPAAQDADMSKLFAGFKGMQPNADTRPIFGANAPAPRDVNGSGKVANAASMDQIIKLLMGGVKGPQVPTIGGLMGRG